MQGTIEGLFEFLFGANACINRAKYWRSVVLFYLLRGVLGQLAKSARLAGAAGVVVHYLLALGRLCAHDLGFAGNRLPAAAGSNSCGSDPLVPAKRRG